MFKLLNTSCPFSVYVQEENLHKFHVETSAGFILDHDWLPNQFILQYIDVKTALQCQTPSCTVKVRHQNTFQSGGGWGFKYIRLGSGFKGSDNNSHWNTLYHKSVIQILWTLTQQGLLGSVLCSLISLPNGSILHIYPHRCFAQTEKDFSQ